MAKQSCCPKKKLRRGLWSPEEDEKLMNHIAKYGHGCWSSVPKLAGLERCGKSCRLRWINYLRPDLKRGTFSQEEEDLIIHLHSMLGNKWSQIAAQLPGRTDNEVKNFWNSYIKKRLRERGIDPVTHKPLPEATAGGSGGVAASTAMTTTSCAVFSDAELVPAHLPPMPAMDGSSVKFPLDRHTSLSCYQTPTFAGYFDMDALNCHSLPPAVIPSASSSSTLNSMAGLSPVAAEEQCNVTTNALELQSGAGNLPWQELGPCTDALDELRWCDYFEGSFQSTASHGAGQCVYEDSKGGVQFDVHGLSNWC